MLMDELRTKTAALHRATEAAFDLQYVSASRPNYTTMLRTLLSIYRPLERRLDRVDWTATTINWPARRKTALLERDLIALGEGTRVEESLESANIPIRSPAHALGCLYVLEGSTLGAQFIVKQLERTLKLNPQNGAAFFTGYGTKTRDMWSVFNDAANAYAGEDHVRTADAIDAACWTFSCFEMMFKSTKSPDLLAS